jgi:hypothetical protein
MTSGDVLLCDLNPVAGREQGGYDLSWSYRIPATARCPGFSSRFR